MTESEQPTAVDVVKPEKKSQEELEKLDKTSLIETITGLYDYIEATSKSEDLQALKESEDKCRQQLTDVTRRENMLLKSLTEKEREIADLAAQIEELKQYQLPSNNQLRTMLLEPTVNVVINRLRKELDTTKQRLEESQSELNAWKFTQDSQTGKQLMARCRTLLKENEELGKQISQGRIAKLEGEIALEKKLVEEMKLAQHETEQFVMELDDDTEGLQTTIYLLQQQLKEAKDHIDTLEGKNTPVQEQQKTNTNLAETDTQQPSSEPMDESTTNDQLTTDISEPLTLPPTTEEQLTTASSDLVNGVEELIEPETERDPELVKLVEKVTTHEEDKTLTTPALVDSNGHMDVAA